MAEVKFLYNDKYSNSFFSPAFFNPTATNDMIHYPKCMINMVIMMIKFCAKNFLQSLNNDTFQINLVFFHLLSFNDPQLMNMGR